MKIRTIGAHARAVLDGSGVCVKYELHGGRFVWNFYHDDRHVGRVKNPSTLVTVAQRIVASVSQSQITDAAPGWR